LPDPEKRAGVVEQLHDAGRQRPLVVRLDIEPGPARRHPRLAQVVGHHRQAEEHVLDDLVHRALVGPGVLGVRVHAEVGRGQDFAQRRVAHPAGEGAAVRHSDLLGVAGHRGLVRAAAHQHAVNVAPAELVAQQLDRAHQVVDAVLLADLAEVDDEEAPPLRPGGDAPMHREPVEGGPGADDMDVGRLLAAAGGRDRFVALVRRDHDLSDAERHPFEPHQAAEQRPVLAVELGGVHLRRKVVVVEHEHLAEQPPERAEQPVSLRRVAGMQHVEAASEQRHPEGEQRRHDEAPGELAHEAEGALRVGEQGVAVDLDAFEPLPRLIVAFHLRADDADAATGLGQRGRFEPDPAVEWHRQVLHYDQHALDQHAPARCRCAVRRGMRHRRLLWLVAGCRRCRSPGRAGIRQRFPGGQRHGRAGGAEGEPAAERLVRGDVANA